MRWPMRVVVAMVAIAALLAAAIAWLNLRGEDPLVPDSAAPASA